MGAGTQAVTVDTTTDGVPSLLLPFLDHRVRTCNPLLDIRAHHSALTCSTAVSLLVAIVFDEGAGPNIYRVCGATAGSRAVEPLASHDGQAAAVWNLRHPHNRATLVQWRIPDALRGHVGAWALTCPVSTSGGAGTLILFPTHADAGMLHSGWASGTLPQQLVTAALSGRPVPLSSVDAVTVPWVSVLSTKSRVPPLEGLVHAQWPRDDMDAGVAVIEGAVLRTTWVWDAPPANSRALVRAPLALPEGVGLGMLLTCAGTAVCGVLMPGHVLGRTAERAPPNAGAVHLHKFIPWGHQ
jgi:hypothetical protein